MAISRKPGLWYVCHAAGSFTYQRQVSVNDSKSYGCTQSALNDHHINITHRTSIITTFFVFELMRNVYLVANSCRNPCWAPRALGAYDKCQYRFHSIIHVNARCFSLRQKFETVHMCAIESTGHPEEACSLQPKFLNEVKCFHDNYWNGQPLPDYSKQTNYTWYTWSMH